MSLSSNKTKQLKAIIENEQKQNKPARKVVGLKVQQAPSIQNEALPEQQLQPAANIKRNKKVKLPEFGPSETAQSYHNRLSQHFNQNPVRYYVKRNTAPSDKAKSSLMLWREALKQANVKGVPRKNSEEYKRARDIYTQKKQAASVN